MFIKDFYQFLTKQIYILFHKDSMIPPRSLSRAIGPDGDFEKVGEEFKNYFIKYAQLEKNAKVLDVGCGVGRIAIPLTDYLNEEGNYYGIDINEKLIKWCNERISTKHPNFRFIHSDILNKHYNKNGKALAHEYKFPFDNETFDFIFLTSVFTHMFPADIENYMQEISRVLKHKGKCLITFFIINDESKRLMELPGSSHSFKFHNDEYFYNKELDPEAAIAFEEHYINSLFKSNGMTINNPFQFGSWCCRDNFLSFQDIVVATKD